jgi:hypothetical protein
MGNAGSAKGGMMQSNRVGQWDSGGMMDGTMLSERQTKHLICTLDLVFFC